MLVSFAGRVWGPVISGLLGGLPVIVGPILMFLYLDHGINFAASAALGSLAGVSSLALFCFTYAWTSQKFGVATSLGAGVTVFFLFTYIFLLWQLAPTSNLLLALGLIFLASRLFPNVRQQKLAYAVPNCEIAFRIIAAAILVSIITYTSSAIGPRLSGLLAPFPVVGTILTGFTHGFYGHDAAVALLKGFLKGLVGMAFFDYMLIVLSKQSIDFSLVFVLSACIALVTSYLATRLSVCFYKEE